MKARRDSGDFLPVHRYWNRLTNLFLLRCAGVQPRPEEEDELVDLIAAELGETEEERLLRRAACSSTGAADPMTAKQRFLDAVEAFRADPAKPAVLNGIRAEIGRIR